MWVVFEVSESWERRVWSLGGDRVVAWAVSLARKSVTALTLACGRQKLVDFQPGPLRLSPAIDGDDLGAPSLRIPERL